MLYEEAPAAYKNIEDVVQDLIEAGLVSVIATFRPLLTYKTRRRREGDEVRTDVVEVILDGRELAAHFARDQR